MTPGNDRTTIITFAVIAALVLAMACVNFVNLATARACQRAREVALDAPVFYEGSVVLLLQHPDRLILSRHVSALEERARRKRAFRVV